MLQEAAMAIILRLDRMMGRSQDVIFTTLNGICRALDCRPGDILEYIPDEVED